jgi:hypothetical protein
MKTWAQEEHHQEREFSYTLHPFLVNKFFDAFGGIPSFFMWIGRLRAHSNLWSLAIILNKDNGWHSFKV